MKILVDEDLPPALVLLLNSKGHSAEHVCGAGLRGRSDTEVFQAAQESGAMLFTADVAFGNPHQFRSPSGVVVFRFPDWFRRSDILSLAERFLETADLQELAGATVVVTPGDYRVRR